MGCQKNTIDAGPEPEAFNNNVNGNETNSDGALSTQQQQQPQQQQQSKKESIASSDHMNAFFTKRLLYTKFILLEEIYVLQLVPSKDDII